MNILGYIIFAIVLIAIACSIAFSMTSVFKIGKDEDGSYIVYQKYAYYDKWEILQDSYRGADDNIHYKNLKFKTKEDIYTYLDKTYKSYEIRHE